MLRRTTASVPAGAAANTSGANQVRASKPVNPNASAPSTNPGIYGVRPLFAKNGFAACVPLVPIICASSVEPLNDMLVLLPNTKRPKPPLSEPLPPAVSTINVPASTVEPTSLTVPPAPPPPKPPVPPEPPGRPAAPDAPEPPRPPTAPAPLLPEKPPCPEVPLAPAKPVLPLWPAEPSPPRAR